MDKANVIVDAGTVLRVEAALRPLTAIRPCCLMSAHMGLKATSLAKRFRAVRLRALKRAVDLMASRQVSLQLSSV